ncbi:type II secretion system major pseudopilin GspG [Candidatus Dependentiae bacterium]
MTKYSKSGFSLMEILVAVAILGVVAAVVGPALYNYLRESRVKAAKMQLKSYQQAIGMFNMHTGEYPATLKGLVRRPSNPEIARKWMGGIKPKKGGYLKKLKVKDPWGTPYRYSREQYKDNPYTLFSYGPDRRKAKAVDRIHVWDID